MRPALKKYGETLYAISMKIVFLVVEVNTSYRPDFNTKEPYLSAPAAMASSMRSDWCLANIFFGLSEFEIR